MATLKTITITATRKVSANYNTREAGCTATVELAEGDNPRDVINDWTKRLQMACDRAVGDPHGSHSFEQATQYQPPFPVPASVQMPPV